MKVGPVVTFMGQPSHCSKRNEREEIFFVTASFFCMISKMHCPVLYYVVGFCWFLHWCPLPFAGNHRQFNDLIAFLLYQLLIFTLRKFWSQDLFFFYFLCSLTFCKPRDVRYSGTYMQLLFDSGVLLGNSCAGKNAVGHLPWQHYTVFKIPHSDSYQNN